MFRHAVSEVPAVCESDLCGLDSVGDLVLQEAMVDGNTISEVRRGMFSVNIRRYLALSFNLHAMIRLVRERDVQKKKRTILGQRWRKLRGTTVTRDIKNFEEEGSLQLPRTL